MAFHSVTKFSPVKKQHAKYIKCSLRKIDDSPKGTLSLKIVLLFAKESLSIPPFARLFDTLYA